MGKGGKPKIEVTEFFMSEHFGVCTAEPDALLEIVVKEKTAWSGSQSGATGIEINNPELFGGIRKEGGLQGTAYWLPGASDQKLPDELAQKLGRANGDDCPGFRGLASLFFYGSGGRGFYWTANAPYLPGVWAKVQRIYKRANGEAQWYSEKAQVPSLYDDDLDYQFVFIDAVDNAGQNNAQALANGVTISGFSPSDVVNLAVTTVDENGSSVPTVWAVGNGNFSNEFVVFKDGDVSSIQSYGTGQSSPGITFARREGLSLTGASSYTLAIIDTGVIADNTGGLGFLRLGNGVGDMNPAHIIHECLTDTSWGMGTPETALDDDAFRAAADTLFSEGFGLSMLWTRRTSIEAFVQEVLDHIQAVLFVDPATGLLTLKLIRGDYDEGALDILTPDNAELSNFSRKLWGEITNEIVVTWTNPENEKEETITVQDDASIATQGGVISDPRNYYGVRSARLAMQLAYRDLRSAGQPLASCDVSVDRSQYDLRPGSVIKVTWPEYDLSEVVMRVQYVDYGRPGDPEIKAQLMEDVFGLDAGAYGEPASSAWVDPSAAPDVIETVEIFTLPYFFALGSSVGEFTETPEYPEVVAGILATTENSDTYSYALWDEVTLASSTTEWQSLGDRNIIGRALLDADLALEAESSAVAFSSFTGNTAPTVGGFAIIGNAGEAGNEIAMITVDNGGDYDLVRGVLDTVPRSWPAGTPVWFVDESTVYEDSIIRSAAQTVDYRLLSRTSQGALALDDAPDESGTLTARPWLPNRPANVTAYGEAWSAEDDVIDARERADPWITVTWAIRNRLDEDALVLSWTDVSASPEAGQTTTIEVRDANDGTLIATHNGLLGTSFDVPDSSFGTAGVVELRVYSERSEDSLDLVSLQYFSHWVQVGGDIRVTEGGEVRLTETGDVRRLES